MVSTTVPPEKMAEEKGRREANMAMESRTRVVLLLARKEKVGEMVVIANVIVKKVATSTKTRRRTTQRMRRARVQVILQLKVELEEIVQSRDNRRRLRGLQEKLDLRKR